MAALLITHPDVVVAPDLPVVRWRLSDIGVRRMRSFVGSDAVEGVRQVWSSTEAKAIEAAGLLAARFGLPVQVDPDLGENDRTSTGFLPPAEFEAVADEFFAKPFESVRGWETAVGAQARIARAVERILNQLPPTGDVAIIAHGAVGTLLMCAFLNQPISREQDQPFQGHFWSFDPRTREVLHTWKAIAPREVR
jgi:broad specificity phosphatase PhoE